MGKRRFTVLITVVFGFLGASAALADCAPDIASLRGDFGEAQFTIQVADDPAEQSRGLMFVEQMATTEGMLFVYDSPRRVSFWMRNTMIPLDMLFFDVSGALVHIHPMAQPYDETPIFGGDNIKFVLEVNGGVAQRFGIDIGDTLQHPSIGNFAKWPCEAN